MPEGFFAFAHHRPERVVASWFLAAEVGSYTVEAWRKRTTKFWSSQATRGDNYFWFHQQFADLFAIAQASPGPNILIVTLIGWQVAGLAELRALRLGAGVGVLDRDRERAGLHQCVGERLGLVGLGLQGHRDPHRASVLHFVAVGELVLEVMDAGAALVEARVEHQGLVQRARSVEAELSAVSERATKAERAATEFEAALKQLQHEASELQTTSAQNLRRAEAAEKHASNLIRDIAELERNRNEMSQTLKRMTTDATDLRTMAESVSKRTEWIEAELRKQGSQGGKTKADVEEARAKILSLSGELQAALDVAVADVGDG